MADESELRADAFVPTPSHLTLRCKNGKTTVLVYAQATDDMDSVKASLLTALRSSGRGSLNGVPIPSSTNDVELALPEDRTDLSKGWKSIVDPSETDTDGGNLGTVKGEKASGLTPRALSIKDNAMLAFRFRSSASGDEWPVKVASLDDGDADLDDEEPEEPNDGSMDES